MNAVRTVSVCVALQKLKEFLEGRTLITKLEAKRDLIEKTMGESECNSQLGICVTLSPRFLCVWACVCRSNKECA